MNYDVDYFIRKFEAIPEELWGIENLSHDGKSCVLGHCGTTCQEGKNQSIATYYIYTKEGKSLVALFNEIKSVPYSINDRVSKEYPQPTPKQRVLAALYDIKKLQQPETPKEKVIVKYVSVSPAIKEMEVGVN